jgi:SAM-dependent methyltransferase
LKICHACGESFKSILSTCPLCEFDPTRIEDFIAYAPEMANSSQGFKNEYFAELSRLEENNFWFKARNKLIIWSLSHYFQHINNFFEIGCGTGFVLSGIKESFPALTLCGSEIFSTGLKYAKDRVKDVTLFQMDARKIPFKNEFDVIGAFDVLEHISEDDLVLEQMHQALHDSGGIILTVPQHPFLWSIQDEYACHIRRYTKRELANKIKKAGFHIEKMTSFVSLLLPLMYASRFRKQKDIQSYDPFAELKLPSFLNWVFAKCMNIDRLFIRCGINLPIGGSLLVIAKKYRASL